MGTTIAKILISYDIDKLHSQVKKELLELGYFDSWKITGFEKIYQMPNTTLWHPKKSSDQGMIDLRNVCKQLGVKLERVVSVKASEFIGI